MPLCAFGLVASCSECFGFDDNISHDHDFGPSGMYLVKRKDYSKYHKKILETLNKLPKEFKNFKALKESEWGFGRRGLIKIEDFYYNLGQENSPQTIFEWQKIPKKCSPSYCYKLRSVFR